MFRIVIDLSIALFSYKWQRHIAAVRYDIRHTAQYIKVDGYRWSVASFKLDIYYSFCAVITEGEVHFGMHQPCLSIVVQWT